MFILERNTADVPKSRTPLLLVSSSELQTGFLRLACKTFLDVFGDCVDESESSWLKLQASTVRKKALSDYNGPL